MTPIFADISAAPHLPPALRSYSDAEMTAHSNLSGRSQQAEAMQDSRELFLVSHPFTAD
jgi:hypothetical protein